MWGSLLSSSALLLAVHACLFQNVGAQQHPSLTGPAPRFPSPAPHNCRRLMAGRVGCSAELVSVSSVLSSASPLLAGGTWRACLLGVEIVVPSVTGASWPVRLAATTNSSLGRSAAPPTIVTSVSASPVFLLGCRLSSLEHPEDALSPEGANLVLCTEGFCSPSLPAAAVPAAVISGLLTTSASFWRAAAASGRFG